MQRKFAPRASTFDGFLRRTCKDMTKKIRLVVEMLRNGVNGKMVLRERLVLQRITDLIASVLDLWEGVCFRAGWKPNTWTGHQGSREDVRHSERIGLLGVLPGGGLRTCMRTTSLGTSGGTCKQARPSHVQAVRDAHPDVRR